VAPTVILTEPKNLVMVYGIDFKSFNALSKGFLFRDGRPFEGPDDAIADDIIAQTRHLKVGSEITLLNHTFSVCGIVAAWERREILHSHPHSTGDRRGGESAFRCFM